MRLQCAFTLCDDLKNNRLKRENAYFKEFHRYEELLVIIKFGLNIMPIFGSCLNDCGIWLLY